MSGVLAVILGIVVLAWPGISILVAAILFGAYLLVTGIAQVVMAFSLHVTAGGRVLLFISGAAALILAVLAFRHFGEGYAILLLAIWIGVGFVFRGVATTVAAISDPTLPGRGWQIFVGVISLIAGVVVIASPFESILTLAIVVGVWLIVIGVFEVVSAFGIRKAAKSVSKLVEPCRRRPSRRRHDRAAAAAVPAVTRSPIPVTPAAAGRRLSRRLSAAAAAALCGVRPAARRAEERARHRRVDRRDHRTGVLLDGLRRHHPRPRRGDHRFRRRGSRVKRGEATNGGVAVAGIVLGILASSLGLVFIPIWYGVFDEVGGTDYIDCLSKAGSDQEAVQRCADQFRERVEDKFSVTLTTPAPATP